MDNRPTAQIRLPDVTIFTDGIFQNLNGWWKPPAYVDHFWANACVVYLDMGLTFEQMKAEIEASYRESVASFWRENVL